MNRGISLLEVLFAMFVMTIGLLGLATLVPVGQFQVMQATHIDAANVIARSATREFKVRDMMDEASWIYLSAASTYTPAYEPYEDANNNGSFDLGELFTDRNGNGSRDTPATFLTTPAPFIIDGLGLATYASDTDYKYFPYGSSATSLGTASRLERISIKDLESGTNITAAQADRIFRLTDDKNFSLPTDTTLRPVLVNSTGTAQQQSRGEYSWMVMVSPLLYYDSSGTAHFHTALGRVNIIAFHRRDLQKDTGIAAEQRSERTVWGDVNYSGQGTFDLTLRSDTTLSDVATAKKTLKLLAGQWVMLSGAGAGQHAWCRVVTASEVDESTFESDVTLAGPDVTFTDADSGAGGAAGTQVVVTICDGVIGVFEKTVQLDEPSLWTTH